jgi:hypothetical protein
MRNKFILSTIATLIVFVVIFSTTSSMSTDKHKLELFSKEEMKEWRNNHDTLFKKDSAVAIFEHYEFEYNPNHKNKDVLVEFCFVQIDNNPDNTEGLLRYVHTIHTQCKIQVEFKDQYDRINLWRDRMK